MKRLIGEPYVVDTCYYHRNYGRHRSTGLRQVSPRSWATPPAATMLSALTGPDALPGE